MISIYTYTFYTFSSQKREKKMRKKRNNNTKQQKHIQNHVFRTTIQRDMHNFHEVNTFSDSDSEEKIQCWLKNIKLKNSQTDEHVFHHEIAWIPSSEKNGSNMKNESVEKPNIVRWTSSAQHRMSTNQYFEKGEKKRTKNSVHWHRWLFNPVSRTEKLHVFLPFMTHDKSIIISEFHFKFENWKLFTLKWTEHVRNSSFKTSSLMCG